MKTLVVHAKSERVVYFFRRKGIRFWFIYLINRIKGNEVGIID